MSSNDGENQRDELDALTSILDEATLEITEKTTTTDLIRGTLIIEITLPDEFFIEYHTSIRMIYSSRFFNHSIYVFRSTTSYRISTSCLPLFYASIRLSIKICSFIST